MTDLVEVTPKGPRLHLHTGQTEVWDATERFVFMIAGTQSGKTSFGPWWLRREIYGDQYVQGRGGGDYLAVASSFDMFKLKMLPEMLNVFEHILKVGRYYAGTQVIELRDPLTGKFWAEKSSDPMWGRIILRSATAKAGLESTTAKAAWLDEVGQDEFSVLAYEAVLRRLSLSMGRILGTTTPYSIGWLKRRIFDRQHEADIRVVQFASTLNPNFPQAEFERAKRDLPGWKFRMFYMGQFERPAGMIYSDFIDAPRSEGGHKVEPFIIPNTFTHYVGVDPGAPNFATLWLAHDTAQDIYYVYRASLEGKKSSREHAGDMLAYARQHLYNVVIWGAGSKSEEQQRLDLQEFGLMAQPPPFHDVESGIDKVISLLRQHRLFYFEDDGQNGMNLLFDEKASYRRILDDEGDPTEKIADKARYHLLDAMRYAVASTGNSYVDAGEIVRGTFKFG